MEAKRQHLYSDPNWLVILSFFESFGSFIGLSMEWNDLESIALAKEASPLFNHFFVKLVRPVYPSVTKRNVLTLLQTYAKNHCFNYPDVEFFQLSNRDRVRLLKDLVESQFDFCKRLQNSIAKISSDEMRFRPLGQAKNGDNYWYISNNRGVFLLYKGRCEAVKFVASKLSEIDDIILSLTPNQSQQTRENECFDSCQICEQRTNPKEILLCDFCEMGYHMSCLVPCLVDMPEGDWYCPDCSEVRLRTMLIRERKSIISKRRQARQTSPRNYSQKRSSSSSSSSEHAVRLSSSESEGDDKTTESPDPRRVVRTAHDLQRMLKGLPKSRTSGWIAQKRFESLRKESEDDSSSSTSSDEFLIKRNSSGRSSETNSSGRSSSSSGGGPGVVNRRQKRVGQRKTAKPVYHPFYGKIYYPTDDDDSDEDCEKPRRKATTSFSTAPLHHHRQPSHTAAVSFAENLSSNDENYEPEDDLDSDDNDDEIVLSDRSFSSFESENPIQSLSRALSSASRSGSSSAGSSASEAKQEKRVVLLPLVDNDLFTTELSPKKTLLWSSSEEIEDFSDSN